MPFMGRIVVPERKCFPASVNEGGAGEISAYAIIALIFGQHFLYRDCNKLAVLVPEPETHWRDFSICVCAGNHLHRNINA